MIHLHQATAEQEYNVSLKVPTNWEEWIQLVLCPLEVSQVQLSCIEERYLILQQVSDMDIGQPLYLGLPSYSANEAFQVDVKLELGRCQSTESN